MVGDMEESNLLHRVLSQTMHLYFSRNYQLLERLGVHPGQVPVLFELQRKGGMYQKELCDSLCLRAPTVTVMLRRMMKNGLVERRHDEQDQRRYRIFLTPAGNRTLEEVKQTTRRLEQECFANFTREELLLLKRFAMQVRDNLAVAAAGAAVSHSNKSVENQRREGNPC